MTPNIARIIREKGKAIRCEAEPGEGGGHAGLIVLVEEDKARAILGRTDPTFETAKAAVSAMKDTVETIRNGQLEPEAESEEAPDVKPKPAAAPAPSVKIPPERGKSKTRKKKGRKYGRQDSHGDDGRTKTDGRGRKREGRRLRSEEDRG